MRCYGSQNVKLIKKGPDWWKGIFAVPGMIWATYSCPSVPKPPAFGFEYLTGKKQTGLAGRIVKCWYIYVRQGAQPASGCILEPTEPTLPSEPGGFNIAGIQISPMMLVLGGLGVVGFIVWQITKKKRGK